MRIGHIEDEEMVKLTQQLQNVINGTDPERTELDKQNKEIDTHHQDDKKNKGTCKELSCYRFSFQVYSRFFWIGGYEWIERWLRKPTNTTKQNLPPFAVSGDINDAIFPMAEYILQQLGVEDQLLLSTQSSTVKVRNIFECDIIKRPIERPSSRDLFNQFHVDDEYTYGKCTGKIECVDGISQVFADRHPSTDEDTQNETRLPCLPVELSNHSKNRAHKCHDLNRSGKSKDEQEESVKYIAKKYQSPSRAELDVYFKQFAQRMKENAIEFEKFCATAVAQRTGRKKRRILQ